MFRPAQLYSTFGNFFRIDVELDSIYPISEEDYYIKNPSMIFSKRGHLTYVPIEGVEPISPTVDDKKHFVTKAFANALRDKGYKIKKSGSNVRSYVVFHEKMEWQPNKNRDIFSLYKGFEYRFLRFNDDIFLCIDPHLVFKAQASLGQLVDVGLDTTKLSDFSVTYNYGDRKFIFGYLLQTTTTVHENVRKILCKIKNQYDYNIYNVDAYDVFPEQRPELFERILRWLGRETNIIYIQRKLSWLSSKTASKDRFSNTVEIVNILKDELFPIEKEYFSVKLNDEPIVGRI